MLEKLGAKVCTLVYFGFGDFGDALVHVSTKVAGPRVRWLVDRVASHVNEYSAHDVQKVMLACWDLELDLDFWKVLCGRAQQVIDEFTTEENICMFGCNGTEWLADVSCS